MPDDAAARALLRETYDDYRRFVNPSLARVMRLSGTPVAVSALGTEIVDQSGRRLLDFAGGYGTFSLGHRHPRVVAAVEAQLREIALSPKTTFDPLAGRLARRLAEIAPGDCEVSFFANSGGEAIEAALKLAAAATGRSRIVATDDGYHGKTLGALAASGAEAYRAPFAALLAPVTHVPFGDAAALAGALEAGDVAAFVVEPVQGEGGVNVPPLGYLAEARRLCDETGTLLVVDEVQTGLGRCGYLFACERDGVVPDVVTLAKGLSGGVVPIGVAIARRAAWDRAYASRPLLHSSTFGGSPLACAAALAALDVTRDERLVERARDRGAHLLAGARRIAARYPEVVAEARGLGLLVGLELTSEGYGGAIVAEMLRRGVTTAWTLNRQRVLRLEPPLIVIEAEIDVALAALRASVEAALARLGDRGSSSAAALVAEA